jgi:hypothetical protein
MMFRAVVSHAGLRLVAVALLLALNARPVGAEGGFSSWSVDEESRVNDEVRLRLSMLTIYTGGAGAARLTFLRRAEEIARESGYREAVVLHYAEGISSGLFFAHRYAEGVVRLLP